MLAAADPAGHHAPLAAADAARAARALARQLERPLDAARAGFWCCVQLHRAGCHVEVAQDAPELLPELAAAAFDSDRHELLRLLTLSASEVGAYDVALDAAHELVRSTANLADDGPALVAAYSLAVCFERMGDAWQAVRVLSEALNQRSGEQPPRPLLLALNGLCAVCIGAFHRRRGVSTAGELDNLLARADGAGRRALALLPQVPEAPFEAAILGNLGEVALHRGQPEDAARLLQLAADCAADNGLTAHAWRIASTQADWLLEQGRTDEALAAARQLLAKMDAAAPLQTAVRAQHTAYRACRQLRRFEEALAHFENFERLERQRVTSQLQAQSQLFVSRIEAQRSQQQVERARLDAQHERARAAEFAERAERDPLTGLGNRRHLDRRFAELLPDAERRQLPLALAVIDIDHFKRINDLYGHAVGDGVLVAFAQLLRDSTRHADVLVRQGGEEFVIVLPGMSAPVALEVCERLRERIGQHRWSALPPGVSVTASIGLAGVPPYDAAELLRQADTAMYRAKRNGRNLVREAA